jgi:hypothetical protein
MYCHGADISPSKQVFDDTVTNFDNTVTMRSGEGLSSRESGGETGETIK